MFSVVAMVELGDLTATIGDMLCADFQFLVPAGVHPTWNPHG